MGNLLQRALVLLANLQRPHSGFCHDEQSFSLIDHNTMWKFKRVYETFHETHKRRHPRHPGCKNHLYGDRYYPSLISNQNYFQTVLKYVYQNPIRAGLCNSVLEYEFSTLPSFLGRKKMQIPIFDDYQFFEDLNGNINWLNDVFQPDATEQIQHGLKLQEFKFKPNKSYYSNDTQSQYLYSPS